MTVGEPEINLNTWGIRYEIIKAPTEQAYVESKDPKTKPKKQKPKGKKGKKFTNPAGEGKFSKEQEIASVRYRKEQDEKRDQKPAEITEETETKPYSEEQTGGKQESPKQREKLLPDKIDTNTKIDIADAKARDAKKLKDTKEQQAKRAHTQKLGLNPLSAREAASHPKTEVKPIDQNNPANASPSSTTLPKGWAGAVVPEGSVGTVNTESEDKHTNVKREIKRSIDEILMKCKLLKLKSSFVNKAKEVGFNEGAVKEPTAADTKKLQGLIGADGKQGIKEDKHLQSTTGRITGQSNTYRRRAAKIPTKMQGQDGKVAEVPSNVKLTGNRYGSGGRTGGKGKETHEYLSTHQVPKKEGTNLKELKRLRDSVTSHTGSEEEKSKKIKELKDYEQSHSSKYDQHTAEGHGRKEQNAEEKKFGRKGTGKFVAGEGYTGTDKPTEKEDYLENTAQGREDKKQQDAKSEKKRADEEFSKKEIARLKQEAAHGKFAKTIRTRDAKEKFKKMTPEEKEKYIKTRTRKRGSKKKSLEDKLLELEKTIYGDDKNPYNTPSNGHLGSTMGGTNYKKPKHNEYDPENNDLELDLEAQHMRKSLEQIKLEVIQNGIIKTNSEVSKISNPINKITSVEAGGIIGDGKCVNCGRDHKKITDEMDKKRIQQGGGSMTRMPIEDCPTCGRNIAQGKRGASFHGRTGKRIRDTGAADYDPKVHASSKP